MQQGGHEENNEMAGFSNLRGRKKPGRVAKGKKKPELADSNLVTDLAEDHQAENRRISSQIWVEIIGQRTGRPSNQHQHFLEQGMMTTTIFHSQVYMTGQTGLFGVSARRPQTKKRHFQIRVTQPQGINSE
eukprot:TRINITY_DN4721_c0_g1_i4.p2 TRINITY_DN4721_c0_g1~~TRINITY_DN4721_c0_g1_i4.p2  ORF type:complete len:131 (+),score=23.28 TRINITY_DN4721_c0_g1_i4:429-821(+)